VMCACGCGREFWTVTGLYYSGACRVRAFRNRRMAAGVTARAVTPDLAEIEV
jgi:hypothetical protein